MCPITRGLIAMLFTAGLMVLCALVPDAWWPCPLRATTQSGLSARTAMWLVGSRSLRRGIAPLPQRVGGRRISDGACKPDAGEAGAGASQRCLSLCGSMIGKQRRFGA